MIKAVIFDLDGVIVDSLGMWGRIFIKLAKDELDLDITQDEVNETPGLRYEHRLMKIAKERNIEITDDVILKFVDKGRAIYYTDRIKYIEMFPGVKKLMQDLKKKGIKVAIGTNGSRSSVDFFIDHFNIAELIDSAVSYDDVKHGKPAPDIFLKNAKNMNVKPEYCVVIEDANEGLRGARAAHMKTIGVGTSLPKDLLKADVVVDKPKDITVEMIVRL